MKIIYSEAELQKILTEYHSYSNNPIKIGYSTQHIGSVKCFEDGIQINIKEDDDESS